MIDITEDNQKKELERLRAAALNEHIPVMRPQTADLLVETVKAAGPKQVLEIGTCIGLGVVTLLLAGAKKVTTIEIDEDRYFSAKNNIKRFGLTDRCECVLGDCRNVVPLMEGNKYDFIVLDGPKTFYKDFLPYIKNLLLPGGVLFVDDVGFYGQTEGDDLPERKHRTNVLAIREFVKAVKSDVDFECREYKTEDGVLILYYRGDNAKDQLS